MTPRFFSLSVIFIYWVIINSGAVSHGSLCSRIAEVRDGHMPIAPGVTCEAGVGIPGEEPMNWSP